MLRRCAMPKIKLRKGSLSRVWFDPRHPAGGSEMKALRCSATTLAVAAAISLSPAMAQGPKLSSGNAWTGISLPVYHDPVPAHSANPSSRDRDPRAPTRGVSWTYLLTPKAAKIKPHYEWQYHYAGRHAYWEGHWVLVRRLRSAAAAYPDAILPANGTPNGGGRTSGGQCELLERSRALHVGSRGS
jgi:hypothetical protein